MRTILLMGALLFVLAGCGPVFSTCFVCSDTGKTDCPVCVEGYSDCALCVRGRNTRGSACLFCNGKGGSTCTFCNGQGRSACTFCKAAARRR